MYTPSRTQGQSTLVVPKPPREIWLSGLWRPLKNTPPPSVTAPLLQGGVWVGCVRLVGFKGWGVILWKQKSHRTCSTFWRERNPNAKMVFFPQIRYKDCNVCLVFLVIFQREVALYNLDDYNKQSKTIFFLKIHGLFGGELNLLMGYRPPESYFPNQIECFKKLLPCI